MTANMNTKSAFALEALKLHGKQLSPLPIKAGEKRPCIMGWDRYCDEQPTEKDISDWATTYPDAGLGLALGALIDQNADVRLVAVDIDQDQHVRTIKDIVLGDSQNRGSLFVGKRGKRGITFFARSIGLLPGQKIKNSAGMAVELLSRGQQTVLPPTIHPDTNEPYQWVGRTTLLTAELNRLPIITRETMDLIRIAVSSPIGGTHPEGASKIRYLGNCQFDGVEMVYPGSVNTTQWLMAGAAARHNFYAGDDSEQARTAAIDGMVEAATEAYRRSGSQEMWDRDKQWQEAESQYDRQLEKLYAENAQILLPGPGAMMPEVEPKNVSRPKLQTINPVDFHGKPLPERKWLVDGWIPHGEVVSLYGDGGIGKSMLSLQLMTACSLGQPWLSLKTMPCNTFGLFCEDDRDELLRRTAAIAKHYGAELKDLGRMTFVSRVGEDNFLMTFVGEGFGRPTDLSRLVKEYLAEHKPGLIVIDTAADTFGGNENIRAQVRQYIAQGLGGLAKISGGTVLICAHPSRAGLGDGSGTGGSTAWNNSVRARLYLKTVNADSRQRLLSRKKSNYGPIGGDDLALDWKDGAFICLDGQGTDAILHRIKAKELFLAAFDALGEDLSTIRNSTYYAPRTLARMAEVDNLTEVQLAVAMADLIHEGLLRVEESGPPSKRRKVLRRVILPQAVAE